MKFPKDFEEKVDMQKIRIEVMHPWIAKRISELLGFEDDVLINFVYSQLEERVSLFHFYDVGTMYEKEDDLRKSHDISDG